MIDRAQQAADAIDSVAALTPHQARSVLNEYTKDDLIAAIATGHGGVPMLKYLEWTPNDPLTQTATFVAGTVVVFGWVVTTEAFVTPAIDAVLSLGTNQNAATYLDGATVTNRGLIWTVSDLSAGGGTIDGIDSGFAFGNDRSTIFAGGGAITGTLNPDGATVGRVRFYYQACVPSNGAD